MDPGTLWMLVLGAVALAARGGSTVAEMGAEALMPTPGTLPFVPTLPGSSPSLPPIGPIPLHAGDLVAASAPTYPGPVAPITAASTPSGGFTPSPLTPSTTTTRAVAAAPGAQPFQLSDKAMVKLGLAGVKQVTKWFLTPTDTPFAMSPDVATAWQSYRVGEYADYTSWAGEQTPLTEVADLDVASNVDALSSVEGVAGGIDAVAGSAEVAPGLFAGEVGGLESAASSGVEATAVASETISLLGPALQIIGVVGVLVDIGFTITGDQPDVLKAVNIAIDVAIIVCMFVPVWGWIAALVLSLVKIVIGLFTGQQGPSHAQREALETKWYADHGAKPFLQGLGGVLSPRELLRYMVEWGSGSCGGVHEVAISFTLQAPDGGLVQIGHQHVYGAQTPNACYFNVGASYRNVADVSLLTQDAMAELLVEFGESDLGINIQAGIAPELKAPMNTTMDDIVTKKLRAWKEAMDFGLTLDDLDAIATEQRKQPRLMAIAAAFGFAHWRDLAQYHLQDYWTRYIVTSRDGSLNHFAQSLGYGRGWIELRDAVLDSYGAVYDRVEHLDYLVTRMEHWLGWTADPTDPNAIPYVDPSTNYGWGGM